MLDAMVTKVLVESQRKKLKVGCGEEMGLRPLCRSTAPPICSLLTTYSITHSFQVRHPNQTKRHGFNSRFTPQRGQNTNGDKPAQ